MVTLEPLTEGLEYDYQNDLTIIKSEDKIVGFNIFNASKYVQIEGNGNIKVEEKHINSIQDLLEKNNINYKLDVDLSPKFVVGYVSENQNILMQINYQYVKLMLVMKHYKLYVVLQILIKDKMLLLLK